MAKSTPAKGGVPSSIIHSCRRWPSCYHCCTSHGSIGRRRNCYYGPWCAGSNSVGCDHLGGLSLSFRDVTWGQPIGSVRSCSWAQNSPRTQAFTRHAWRMSERSGRSFDTFTWSKKQGIGHGRTSKGKSGGHGALCSGLPGPLLQRRKNDRTAYSVYILDTLFVGDLVCLWVGNGHSPGRVATDRA